MGHECPEHFLRRLRIQLVSSTLGILENDGSGKMVIGDDYVDDEYDVNDD